MEYTSTSKIALWSLQWHNKQLEYNIMQNKISFSYSYILTMRGILATFDCYFAPIPRAPGLNILVGRAPAVTPQLSLKSIILGICGG